jgi:hypothetical protein
VFRSHTRRRSERARPVAGTIAATGKGIEIRSCIVVEMAGDKMKVERQYFDMATMLRQIGVTK